MNEYLFKVLVLGDKGVGKTSFINRSVYGSFSENERSSESTTAVCKYVELNSTTKINLQFWDICEKDVVEGNPFLLFQDSVGAFILFDASNPNTFTIVDKWKKAVDKYARFHDIFESHIPVVILANKVDLIEKFRYNKSLNEYSMTHNVAKWFQISAKENKGIDDAILFMCNCIVEKSKEFKFNLPLRKNISFSKSVKRKEEYEILDIEEKSKSLKKQIEDNMKLIDNSDENGKKFVSDLIRISENALHTIIMSEGEYSQFLLDNNIIVRMSKAIFEGTNTDIDYLKYSTKLMPVIDFNLSKEKVEGRGARKFLFYLFLLMFKKGICYDQAKESLSIILSGKNKELVKPVIFENTLLGHIPDILSSSFSSSSSSFFSSSDEEKEGCLDLLLLLINNGIFKDDDEKDESVETLEDRERIKEKKKLISDIVSAVETLEEEMIKEGANEEEERRGIKETKFLLLMKKIGWGKSKSLGWRCNVKELEVFNENYEKEKEKLTSCFRLYKKRGEEIEILQKEIEVLKKEKEKIEKMEEEKLEIERKTKELKESFEN